MSRAVHIRHRCRVSRRAPVIVATPPARISRTSPRIAIAPMTANTINGYGGIPYNVPVGAAAAFSAKVVSAPTAVQTTTNRPISNRRASTVGGRTVVSP